MQTLKFHFFPSLVEQQTDLILHLIQVIITLTVAHNYEKARARAITVFSGTK